MRKSYLGIVLISLLILGGCKSKQKVAVRESAPQRDNLIEQVIAVEPSFKSMHLSKMTMNMISGSHEFKLRASVKLITDSIISISIMPLMGIEMYRLTLTPKGFTIVDKLNRKYADATYDYIRNKFGITLDYRSVEALLSNQLFVIPASKKPLTECFVAEREATYQLLRSLQKIMERDLEFRIDPYGRISEVDLTDGSSSMMKASYSELKKFDSILFPTQVSVSVMNKKQRMHVDFLIERVTFNNELTISPIEVSRYTKVLVTQLLP